VYAFFIFQYGFKKTGGVSHVPPGWDWWIGLVGNSRYYNYTLSVNGTAVFHSDDYLTDVIVEYQLLLCNKYHDHVLLSV
jgi:N-acetylglucosamine-6-sulfatase